MSGFARVVEKMGRAWGGFPGYSSSSTSTTPKSTASMSTAPTSRASTSTEPTSTASMSTAPTSTASSTAPTSTASMIMARPRTPYLTIADVEAFAAPVGPSLGKRLRGPLKVAMTGANIGNVVFGGRLGVVVSETAVTAGGWSARQESPGLPLPKQLERRMLPALVVRCAQHILIWGVQEEGIFRKAGRPSHISKLRSEFDCGADWDMTECTPEDLDPHAVASVLKAFLRELPDPILTQRLIPYFEAALVQESSLGSGKQLVQDRSLNEKEKGPLIPRSGGPQMRKPPSLSTLAMPNFNSIRPPSQALLNALKSLIGQLPPENRDLIRTVTELIRATAKQSQQTKMPLSNLLLVFCPSLDMNPPLLRVLCEAEGVWGDEEAGAPEAVVVPEVVDVKRETREFVLGIQPPETPETLKPVPPVSPVFDTESDVVALPTEHLRRRSPGAKPQRMHPASMYWNDEGSNDKSSLSQVSRMFTEDATQPNPHPDNVSSKSTNQDTSSPLLSTPSFTGVQEDNGGKNGVPPIASKAFPRIEATSSGVSAQYPVTLQSRLSRQQAIPRETAPEDKSVVHTNISSETEATMVKLGIPRISTFVIFSPKSSRQPAGPSSLRPGDLRVLKNEFADGGTIVSVHSPDEAVLWLEAHYEDPLLKSMRSRGVGGFIAAMLSPEESCLVIFGSIHDGWILKAAQLLSNLCGFAVMIRPLRHNPVPKWEQGSPPSEILIPLHDHQSPEEILTNNDLLTSIEEEEGTEEGNTTSEGSTSSTTTEDSGTTGLNNQEGVFRLRGGAGKDEDPYRPVLSPLHNVDVRLDIHCVGVSYNIDLLTKIQFKTQPEFENKYREGYRPQIVSWTSFRTFSRPQNSVITDRSYSNLTFLVEKQYISQCIEMECNGFIPPQQTTKTVNTNTKGTTTSATFTGGVNPTGTVSHAINNIGTNTVENQNDRVTPKCNIHYGHGPRLTMDDTTSESFEIAYEATEDLTNKEAGHAKYPLTAEFSIGINVVDPEEPNNTVLPRTSFLIQNQTNLWVSTPNLKARGQGIVVLTIAHIPNIEVTERLCIAESQMLHLGDKSLINVPVTDKTPRGYQAKMSLSVAATNGPGPNNEPGRFKKIVNKLFVKALTSRKKVTANVDIPTLRMHEYISRGWDATWQEWRTPIYTNLMSTLQKASGTSETAWNLAIDPAAANPPHPQPKGEMRDTGAPAGDLGLDDTNLRVGADITATPSCMSSTTTDSGTGSHNTSIAATMSTPATSMGTHTAAVPVLKQDLDGEQNKVAGPSNTMS